MSGAMIDVEHGITILAKDDVHQMPETSLLVSCEELLTQRARLDAELARRLQALDAREVTTSECGRTTRGWLVEEQHLSPSEAIRTLWISRRLPRFPVIAEAFAAGEITADHVRVMIGCLSRLPGDWPQSAHDELLGFAKDHDPAMLAALCRELRVRSGADESSEAAAQRRYDSRHLTLARTFDGMLSVSGLLDPEAAATVEAAITPLTVKAGELDERTLAQRTADAFTDLARMALNHGDLPEHGGEKPQVVATLPFSELRDGVAKGQLGTATLNGHPICPTTARRLACDADIIPAVLGGNGDVLNLGRATPTWNRAQRRARRLMDGGCVFPKCQATLARCQIHHQKHWAHGGPTDLDNGMHLCHYHHRLIHHENWTIERTASGKIIAERVLVRPTPPRRT